MMRGFLILLLMLSFLSLGLTEAQPIDRLAAQSVMMTRVTGRIVFSGGPVSLVHEIKFQDANLNPFWHLDLDIIPTNTANPWFYHENWLFHVYQDEARISARCLAPECSQTPFTFTLTRANACDANASKILHVDYNTEHPKAIGDCVRLGANGAHVIGCLPNNQTSCYPGVSQQCINTHYNETSMVIHEDECIGTYMTDRCRTYSGYFGVPHASGRNLDFECLDNGCMALKYKEDSEFHVFFDGEGEADIHCLNARLRQNLPSI
jgi:hypothetical protein